MKHNTGIEWTHPPGYIGETWNPATGCWQLPGKKGRPSGCDNCYAKRLIDTRMSKNPTSVRFGKPFEIVMQHPERLEYPMRWSKPRCVFVNSLSDLFHADITPEFLDAVFYSMMRTSDRHIFQVLTKRPERMRSYIRKGLDALKETGIDIFGRLEENAGKFGIDTPPLPVQLMHWPLHNVWLGTSICSNDDAARANVLRKTPAAIRFLSIEPLLGPVDKVDLTGMDWVIIGGESGSDRVMDLDWARDVRDRCRELRIPLFLKQLGGLTDKRGGADAVLDGRRHVEFPKAVCA